MDGNLRGFGKILVLVAGAVAFTATAAWADGNAKAGAQVFRRCAICHSDTKDAANKIGPNLWGIVGRKAGTEPGFNYSAAMKKAGFVWTDDKLEAYIADPQKVVPGNRMPFAGIHNHQQVEDLVAYLETLK